MEYATSHPLEIIPPVPAPVQVHLATAQPQQLFGSIQPQGTPLPGVTHVAKPLPEPVAVAKKVPPPPVTQPELAVQPQQVVPRQPLVQPAAQLAAQPAAQLASTNEQATTAWLKELVATVFTS